MANYSYIYYFEMHVSPVGGVFLCQQDSQITTQKLININCK